MTEPSKIRVLVGDDHAVVREGLARILAKTGDIEVVAEAATGNEILEKVEHDRFDVLVMDIEMPGKSGWDVMHQLKSGHPKLPVIILSIYSEEHYGIRFLKAGAAGYLTKTGAPDQLVEAIRKVHQGGRYVTPNLADRLLDVFEDDLEKPRHEQLSSREFQIFTLLVAGKSIKTIASELSVSSTTVSTHRARILEKMSLKSNADLVQYAYKNGLVS